jgi:dTDP-4-dehydrorhamnose reductase
MSIHSLRVALLGAGGQLAHDLRKELSKFDTYSFARAELDLADSTKLDQKLSEIRPTHVVNAAAYNLVDQAESEPEAAFAVNAFGVRNLARACQKIGARLMTFSTDYVFGQEAGRGAPYAELDTPGPVSVYGVSKLTGEHFARFECPQSFVVRTCGLYGVKGSRGKGGNFVETMIRLSESGKPISVVDDQRCTPSFTADVAKTAVQLLGTDAFGIHHVVNSGSCTWFEFASEIFRRLGKTVECKPITSEQFNAKARRPSYSVLGMDGLKAAGLPPTPDWKEALGRYLESRARLSGNSV